jgi:hypothetical protein
MARPRKTINEKRVIELASKGLTVKEIAAFENVSHDTITRRFASALERGRLLCNGSIRSKQVQVAMKGNTTMLVWLGKQLCGQRDKTETEHKGAIPVQFVTNTDFADPHA